MGFISGLGGFPGEEHGNPLQYSCLENSIDRAPWWATAHGLPTVRHDRAINTLSLSFPLASVALLQSLREILLNLLPGPSFFISTLLNIYIVQVSVLDLFLFTFNIHSVISESRLYADTFQINLVKIQTHVSSFLWDFSQTKPRDFHFCPKHVILQVWIASPFIQWLKKMKPSCHLWCSLTFSPSLHLQPPWTLNSSSFYRHCHYCLLRSLLNLYHTSYLGCLYLAC